MPTGLTHCVLPALLAGMALAGAGSRIEKTVYHLNPKTAGSLPLDMDTGDARGDLYFYLGQFLLPLECKNVSAQSRAHFDCDNAERRGPDLVVTEVQLEMDSRFTGYSACNLCNGSDPFSRKPCKVGTYICDCESDHDGGPPCLHQRVGYANVTKKFGPSHPTAKCSAALNSTCGSKRDDQNSCWRCVEFHGKALSGQGCQMNDFEHFCPNPWDKCNPDFPPVVEWSCWEANIPRKTGGSWFSTLKEGMGKSWTAKGMKTIKESCLKDTLIGAVEAHDSQGCFGGCGAVRNESSACWIGCFFDTLLGPDAARSTALPLAGMSIDAIERGWTDAFDGRCPELNVSYALA